MQYGPSSTASVSAPVGGILSHRRETDTNGRPSAKIPASDKPDPLDGPFFEETIYVAPSAAGAREYAAIVDAVTQAAAAIGLHHGPVHAECRVNDAGVFVLEVAARPIGGLCARSLRFEKGVGSLFLMGGKKTPDPFSRWRSCYCGILWVNRRKNGDGSRSPRG